MFKKSKILSETESLAGELSRIREDKGLKLEDISKKLNINVKYLRAIEAGQYNQLPAGVYSHNFLREYVLFLGIKKELADKVVLRIKNQDSDPERKKKKDIFSQQVIGGGKFIIMPKIVKAAILAIVVLSFFIYIGFYLKNIMSPPTLEIIKPADNQTVAGDYVDIIGLTEPEARVTVNGEQVLSDERGVFAKKVDLKKGVNVIVITAKKRYGREKIIKKQVLVSGD